MEMTAIKCLAMLQKKRYKTVHNLSIFSLIHISVFGLVVIMKQILKPSLTLNIKTMFLCSALNFFSILTDTDKDETSTSQLIEYRILIEKRKGKNNKTTTTKLFFFVTNDACPCKTSAIGCQMLLMKAA